MPKTKPLTDKEKDLKEFIKLTWEVVRRNSEYRENYIRFLQNYSLLPEDVKPKKREDGSLIIPLRPGGPRQSVFDYEKGRFVCEDEAPDPQRCNHAYMLQKWGFACDPDEQTPQGSNWRSAFISKEWLDKRKKSGPIFDQPLMTERFELQKLPGVLEVKRWPEFWLDNERRQKLQEATSAIWDGWRPKNEQEYQEYLEAVRLRQWEIEDPPQLTITINLQAPSYLIHYALEILVAVCKGDLKISDNKIDGEHIQKCLRAWDLMQQGMTEEEIANAIPLRKYKSREQRRNNYKTPEMIDADRELDSDTPYNLGRVKDYIEKAKDMIQKGAVI